MSDDPTTTLTQHQQLMALMGELAAVVDECSQPIEPELAEVLDLPDVDMDEDQLAHLRQAVNIALFRFCAILDGDESDGERPPLLLVPDVEPGDVENGFQRVPLNSHISLSECLSMIEASRTEE